MEDQREFWFNIDLQVYEMNSRFIPSCTSLFLCPCLNQLANQRMANRKDFSAAQLFGRPKGRPI